MRLRGGEQRARRRVRGQAGGHGKGEEPGSRGQGEAEDFMADEGWQLPGRRPKVEAHRIAAARPHPTTPALPARRRPPAASAGARQPLAGHGAGRCTARHDPLGAVVGALLLPLDGGRRAWTALAGALAPLVLWMDTGRVPPSSEQAPTGRAAHPGEGSGNEDHPDHAPDSPAHSPQPSPAHSPQSTAHSAHPQPTAHSPHARTTEDMTEAPRHWRGASVLQCAARDSNPGPAD